jgi:protein SCO1
VTTSEASSPVTSAPAKRGLKGFIASPLFWILWIGFLFLVPIGRSLALDPPKPPALDVPLPAFSLTNERGEPFNRETLLGKVWVADFIFTSCPTVCPALTKRMGQVQHRARNLGDAFHLVSFTVDPENDTPERLAAYARQNRASPRLWSFVTGPLGELETTVVKGFKISMGKEESAPGTGIFSIFHGEKLVLVDGKGSIRGYYDADDPGIDLLMHDIGVLINVH